MTLPGFINLLRAALGLRPIGCTEREEEDKGVPCLHDYPEFGSWEDTDLATMVPIYARARRARA